MIEKLGSFTGKSSQNTAQCWGQKAQHMATVFRRDLSPFWFACYVDRTGKQVRKSTKSDDRSTALKMALEWEKVAKAEGLVPFMTRAFVRRANGKGMRRLAKQLEG